MNKIGLSVLHFFYILHQNMEDLSSFYFNLIRGVFKKCDIFVIGTFPHLT